MTTRPLTIRAAQKRDVPAIHAVHTASIRGLCSDAYTADEITRWSSNPDSGRFGRQMAAGRNFFVAVSASGVCGFGALDVAAGSIAALFVHPDHARAGIGSALLQHMESTAAAGLTELIIESSRNAQRFYERHGYRSTGSGTYRTSHGLEIACIFLRKRLSPPPST